MAQKNIWTDPQLETVPERALDELVGIVRHMREELERLSGIKSPMVILDPRNERIYVVPTEHLPKWLNAACGETVDD